MSHLNGRHFLQIPGPTNIPERVLLAMAQATIDHRGPEFSRMTHEIFDGLKKIFRTAGRIVMYPASGTGAWEAALVNTLSPGDKVLAFETGQFATQWREMAGKLGLEVEFIEGDWRHGADPETVEARLSEDRERRIKAVMVVHNETSTGIASRIPEIRQAMDRAGHPALLFVDTISSLGSIEYRHDEWEVDVTVGGSQKGLMLPPGLSFNAISEKALTAAKSSKFAKSYWDWQPMFKWNEIGFFPYTPATNIMYGLRESLTMLLDEGLDNVLARHGRHAEATRCAIRAWGLELLCLNPREYSNSLTAILLKPGQDADDLRKVILERFNMSLGAGLGKVAKKVFRIGHLGDFSDLMLAGTLSGVEMGLKLAGIPYRSGGISAALAYLTQAEEHDRASADVAHGVAGIGATSR